MALTLLITGCIDPERNQKWLLISDAKTRLDQYIDSIIFYINSSAFSNIIFCDNSNFDYDAKDSLISYALSKGKKLEWISFEGNKELVKKWGKGAGEDEIVSYVLKNSELMKTANSFAKVTGRLKLQNINQMIQKCHSQNNYFLKDVYRGNKNGVDTRFYFINKLFFTKNLQHCYQKSEAVENLSGKPLEEIYFKLLNNNYKGFTRYFKFSGTSAGNGRNYEKEWPCLLLFWDFLARLRLFNSLFELVFISMKIKFKLLKLFKKDKEL